MLRGGLWPIYRPISRLELKEASRGFDLRHATYKLPNTYIHKKVVEMWPSKFQLAKPNLNYSLTLSARSHVLFTFLVVVATMCTKKIRRAARDQREREREEQEKETNKR